MAGSPPHRAHTFEAITTFRLHDFRPPSVVLLPTTDIKALLNDGCLVGPMTPRIIVLAEAFHPSPSMTITDALRFRQQNV